MSTISKKILAASSGLDTGPSFNGTSFEEWTSGLPVGWQGSTSGNTTISESNSTGVTEGSSAVKFLATGSQAIVGNSASIQRDFDLTDYSLVSVDHTAINNSGLVNAQLQVGSSASTFMSGTGTYSVDVSGLTGNQTIELSALGDSGDGKTSVDSSFEIYWDFLVFT